MGGVCVQLGPPYLKLCHELDVPPAETLVPAIQLCVHAPAAIAAGGARRALAGSDGHVKLEDDEGGAAGGHYIEGALVPGDLALQVVCNDMSGVLYPASCRVQVRCTL